MTFIEKQEVPGKKQMLIQLFCVVGNFYFDPYCKKCLQHAINQEN